jgi:hypothetical protein
MAPQPTPDLNQAIASLERQLRDSQYWYEKSEEARANFQEQANSRAVQRDMHRDRVAQYNRAIRLLRGEPS